MSSALVLFSIWNMGTNTHAAQIYLMHTHRCVRKSGKLSEFFSPFFIFGIFWTTVATMMPALERWLEQPIQLEMRVQIVVTPLTVVLIKPTSFGWWVYGISS